MTRTQVAPHPGSRSSPTSSAHLPAPSTPAAECVPATAWQTANSALPGNPPQSIAADHAARPNALHCPTEQPVAASSTPLQQSNHPNSLKLSLHNPYLLST